jgi:hypothetical protein
MPSSWDIPRRSFLARLSAWAGAGAILPSLRPEALATIATSIALPDRTKAALFEQQLDTTFQIVPDPQAAAPRLVSLFKVTRSVTKKVSGGKTSSTPAYSLLFHEPRAQALPQDTYRVEHPQLGAFPLFLVPVGPKQADVWYEAVFA